VSGSPQQRFAWRDKFGDLSALVRGVAVTLCRPRAEPVHECGERIIVIGASRIFLVLPAHRLPLDV